jgi:acyl carrier protein
MSAVDAAALAAAVIAGVEDACALPRGTATPAGHLVGYGLDSARALDLLARLEDEHGVVIDDADLKEVRTVADLVRVVQLCAQRGPR